MSGTDDKDKGSGAAALLAQLKSQARAERGYDRTLFRVVEVVRGPDGRLSRQGRIWHSDLGHVRRFGRALAANSVSQQVVIADAGGAVIEELAVTGPGAIGWSDWRAKVPPLSVQPPAPAAASSARGTATSRPRAAAPAGPSEPGWATDTLFDEPLPDAAEPLPHEPGAADAASPHLDTGEPAGSARPALGLIPDPTVTGEVGIVLP